MKGILLTEPEKLVVEEVEIPEPRQDEILLKVKRCGICGSDISIYHGKHPYVKCPLVMGHEFSGVVEKLGSNVQNLSVGTRVTVIPHLVCKKCKQCNLQKYNLCEELKVLGAQADGAFQEYITIPAEMAIPIPDSMSLDDAAMVEPACVAYHAAKRGGITQNDKILIMGAGPIGVFVMQSSRVLGAKSVFITDIDETRLRIASNLGADRIFNLSNKTLEDIDGIGMDLSSIGIFFDCVGGRGEVLNSIIKTASKGVRIIVVGVMRLDYEIPNLPDFIEHELTLLGTSMYVPQDYKEMVDLISSGKISTKGMITHHFSISELASVFDMIDSGKEKFFKIMLRVSDGF